MTDQQSAEVEAQIKRVRAAISSPFRDGWRDALADFDALAQRIETLTRDLEDPNLMEGVTADAWFAMADRAERAEAQRDRLAEALRRMEEPCPDCGGSGDLINGEECDWCGGSGLVMKPVTEISEIQRAALSEIEQAASNDGQKEAR